MKRKLSDLHENVGAPTQEVMRDRLDHIDKLDKFQSQDEPEFSKWTDTRLDRWLVDWALRTGREKTATKLAREKGIEKLVDIDLFTEIRRIEEALRQHSCTEALSWCSENKVALRKIKSTLEFDLRLQEYIELARARKTEEAIAYTKKHMIQWQETHLSQIRAASALLAFPPETTCGPYKRLYDPVRWSTLVSSFRLAVYSLHSLPTEPLLNIALYAGLAALKLPVCYAHGGPKSKQTSAASAAPDGDGTHATLSKFTTGPSGHNIDCPICDMQSLGQLALEVPWSHHVNSTIVCSGMGKITDADNPPMAFPSNGYVYSREFLQEMASKNGGHVKCPRTGVECDFSELRKVFIS